MTTVTTIGYGDVTGNTRSERMMNIFFMIIGLAFFNYAIGTLSYVIEKMYEDEDDELME